MIAEDLDTRLLEDIFEEEHCEVQHDRAGVKQWCAPCTHQVVARLEHSCNGKSGLVCAATVESAYLTDEWVICRACRSQILECWTFIPV